MISVSVALVTEAVSLFATSEIPSVELKPYKAPVKVEVPILSSRLIMTEEPATAYHTVGLVSD